MTKATASACFAVGIFLVPFALIVLAYLIDGASWALTGHEVFPWLGHSLQPSGK